MQRDLDNLKEMLSGQITFDTNILTNIFNPDEPLVSIYFVWQIKNIFFNLIYSFICLNILLVRYLEL